MKQFQKIVALLLCTSMLFGITGCTPPSAETLPPTSSPIEPTEEPTAPPADLVYQEAAELLNNMSDISLALRVTKATVVADQPFTEQRDQIVSYYGLGSDDLLVSMEESFQYDIDITEEYRGKDNDESDENDDKKIGEESSADSGDDVEDYREKDVEIDLEEFRKFLYTEVYSGGTLYTNLTWDGEEDIEAYRFSSPLTEDEAAARYVPPVLIDAALYEEVYSELSGDSVALHFASPTAPEVWAIPEGAEMLDASGSALVSKDGAFEQMVYSITYQHGPAQITLEVESKPQIISSEAVVPENPDDYTHLDYADALKVYLETIGMLFQSEAISTSLNSTIVSRAAAFVWSQSIGLNSIRGDDDLLCRYELDNYISNEPYDVEERSRRDITYRDNVQTTILNYGVPTVEKDVSKEDLSILNYILLVSSMPDPKYWTNATLTEENGFHLIEYTYSEDFSNTMQNVSCALLWDDITFLNQHASDYQVTESSGHLSLNAYTRLPTGAGYHYEGQHTIEGSKYTLSYQNGQSFDIPSKEAYFKITGELPEEPEPEVKATPLLYHVTGPNGEEIWLFGTMDVGDARTAYLPQEVYDALEASDILALEYYEKAFWEKLKSDPVLYQKYIETFHLGKPGDPPRTTRAHIDQEFCEQAIEYMKITGDYNADAGRIRTYLWADKINDFHLRQGYQLTQSQKVERHLERFAENKGIEIWEYVSFMDNLYMKAAMSINSQFYLLRKALDSEYETYNQSTIDLYNKWCAGDEDGIREALTVNMDTSTMTEEELAVYNDYGMFSYEYWNQAVKGRTPGIFEAVGKYLKSDEVAFFAIDITLLLDSTKGILERLRNVGYTVELVEYAQ